MDFIPTGGNGEINHDCISHTRSLLSVLLVSNLQVLTAKAQHGTFPPLPPPFLSLQFNSTGFVSVGNDNDCILTLTKYMYILQYEQRKDMNLKCSK